MARADGSVIIDTKLNTGGFSTGAANLKTQFSGLTKAAGKLGAVIAAAFSVRAIVNFGKEAMELGSDLQEVQNVVDVTFTTMSDRVNEFAENAMKTAGLSETMAKRYVGTFGAMAKSFRFTEEEAFNMSTALTQMAGDVASFYNITQDEAYTKLKSVFTGETESLKDLGVVMTQTALDDYAMRKGLKKTTNQMSEQEKVALRFRYVLEQLDVARGDFIRTQNSWANQSRIFSVQVSELMAAIGQGLINVLTPALKGINLLVGQLQDAAEAFRDFTAAIFGDAGGASSAIGSAADSTEDLGDAIEEAGKKAKKALAPFDEIIRIGETASSAESDTTVGIPATTPGGSQGGPVNEEKTNGAILALQQLRAELEALSQWHGFSVLGQGFTDLWAGAKAGLDALVSGISEGLHKIDFSQITSSFTISVNELLPVASSALSGVGDIFQSAMGYYGTVLGGISATFGKELEIVSTGFSDFFENESGNISSWVMESAAKISTGFNNLEFSAEMIFGSMWEALDTNDAEIERAITGVLTAFSDAGMKAGTILTDIWNSITGGLASFLSGNQGELTLAYDNLLKGLTGFANSASMVVVDLFTDIGQWWEEDGKPIFDQIVSMFQDVGAWFLRIWNEWISPVIAYAKTEFDKLWKNTLQPLFQNFLSLLTQAGTTIKTVWDFMKPIVDWLIAQMGPQVKQVFQGIVDKITGFAKMLSNALNNLLSGLKGALKFIEGVFTGDWKKAWEGLVELVKSPFNAIISFLNGLISAVVSSLNVLIGSLNSVSFDIPDWGIFGDLAGKKFGINIPTITAPQIPYLAQGAVIPPRAPFYAVLGDQRNGMNIEAPEGLIRSIFHEELAKAMGGMHNGFDAVVRAIQDKDTTIELDGDAVGRSVDSYNRKMNTARGGV